MSVLAEVHRSLQTMQFPQLIAAFAFIGGYVLAVSDFFGDEGRQRVWLTTIAGAVAFCFLIDPWMHGILLLALFVGSVGLFVATVALISRALGMSDARLEPLPMPVVEAEVEPVARTSTPLVPAALPVEPA